MIENEVNDQVQDELANDVNESLGMTDGNSEGAESESQENQGSEGSHANATLAVQKRLKAQRRAHEREIRELHSRIGELESRNMTTPNTSHEQAANSYTPPENGSIDEHIHKAVSFALHHKEMEERKAHEAKNVAHVNRQYQEFEKHLDNMGDKYDDFHDVVMGRDTPYTTHMRDYALTLPRTGSGAAGEVLYKLGKNPELLEKISKLHPLDQASEMAKLSHALISGGEKENSQTNRPLGQIKNNPVTHSHAVTDKTPIGSIRQRMKSGSWK